MLKKITLVLLVATSLYAGSIEYSWNSSREEVQLDSFDQWDVITIDEGMPVFGNGYPNLPAVPRCYVIPQGTTVTRVEVTNISTISLGRALLPVPVMIVPLSGDVPEIPNYTEICFDEMEASFPTSQIVGFKTGSKTGFRLGSYSFVPFVYKHQTGELLLITSADIELVYEHDSEAPVYYLTEGQEELARRVISTFIDNPEMLNSYAPAHRGETDDDIDVVVIGYAQQSEQLDDLVAMHVDWGYTSENVTIQWIIANVEGYDVQEKIRNYLKERLENNGLQFVVMCGDGGATTRLSSLEDPVDPYLMNSFTDLYFSDLDGTWDANGNHLYGEEFDEIDYYTDVYIGRYPASITEIDALIAMINKTDLYVSQPESGDWQKRALLLGAIIDPPYPGYEYEWCHGSKYCDSVATFFPADFQWDSVYEDTTGGHANNQLELFNQGVSFLVYAAHGNPDGFYWYYPEWPDIEAILSCDSIQYMTNGSKLPWVDGIVSCKTGSIVSLSPSWNIEGFCERLFQQSTGGAVVALGNSETTYAMLTDPGPSGWISIYHSYMLFDQNLGLAGVTLGGAKDMLWANWNSFYIPRLAELSLNVLNLFGDPCTVFVGSQTGVTDYSQGQVLAHVSPNPVSGTMNINVTLAETAVIEVAVYDMLGRVVMTSNAGIYGAGEHSLSMDASSIAAGIYMVNVTSGEHVNTTKCVVLH